jgi:hypothetical protein
MHSGATITKVGGLTLYPRKLGKFHPRTGCDSLEME